jgi:hypothetical protein
MQYYLIGVADVPEGAADFIAKVYKNGKRPHP